MVCAILILMLKWKGSETMSPIREKVVKIIESLPYNIDKEIFKRDTKDILQDITRQYVDLYGIDDLSEDDKECIQSLIGKI